MSGGNSPRRRADCDETVEGAPSGAARNCFGCDVHTLLEISHLAANDECSCCIEQDDLSERSGLTSEHAKNSRGIRGGVAPLQIAE